MVTAEHGSAKVDAGTHEMVQEIVRLVINGPCPGVMIMSLALPVRYHDERIHLTSVKSSNSNSIANHLSVARLNHCWLGMKS